MQRRLINALEHIRLEYDGTVRDPHGHCSILYGEDGIDVQKVTMVRHLIQVIAAHSLLIW